MTDAEPRWSWRSELDPLLRTWCMATGRTTLPNDLRNRFFAEPEIAELKAMLRRHGIRWMETAARRAVRRSRDHAELVLPLDAWLAACHAVSAESARTPAPPEPQRERPPLRKRVAGLPAVQRYDEDT